MNFNTQKYRLRQRRTQSVLFWSRYFFLAAGLLALGYFGYALVDARLYQAYETWRFEQALKNVKPAAIGSVEPLPLPPLPAPVEADRARVESAAPKGSSLGQIEHQQYRPYGDDRGRQRQKDFTAGGGPPSGYRAAGPARERRDRRAPGYVFQTAAQYPHG